MKEEKVLRVLTKGLKNYCKKNGFHKVILGISGGVDSALTASIAVMALGKDNINGVYMPSKFSSRLSKKNAVLLARNLGIHLLEVPIKRMYSSYIKTMRKVFSAKDVDTTKQNIQSRIRANILMAYSNKYNYLVLATGNKSEGLVGYTTLYGDSAGGIAPIGNVYKTDVYKLSTFINQKLKKEIIPKSILMRPPSAELKPSQKDEDDIPPYSILDEILKLYYDKKITPKKIIKKGYNKEIVNKVVKMVKISEFKRAQSPNPLKIK
ncbi:NAD(+) synthase [Nanoarchaeota archaeon]